MLAAPAQSWDQQDVRSGAPAAGPWHERVAEAGSALHEVRRRRVCVTFVVDDGPVTTANGGSPDWYEKLYAGACAGSVVVPWDHGEPTPFLVEWMAERFSGGGGGRAVVIGCAYGDDAELVSSYGFAVTAFDVSGTAVAAARARHPGSAVDYCRVDLLDLPAEWLGVFDLVVECTTLQSMPPELHERAAASVAALCAPGGNIVVVARCPGDHDPPGPPWLLQESEVRRVAVGDVRLQQLRRLGMRGGDRWVAEFERDTIRAN